MTHAYETFYFTGERKAVYERRRKVYRVLAPLFTAALIITSFLHKNTWMYSASDAISMVLFIVMTLYFVYGLIKRQTVFQMLFAEQKVLKNTPQKTVKNRRASA